MLEFETLELSHHRLYSRWQGKGILPATSKTTGKTMLTKCEAEKRFCGSLLRKHLRPYSFIHSIVLGISL
jgi:hypothetical protein